MNVAYEIALLSNDLIVRSKYLAPGYLSSGGIPCKYDSMTEEEFRKIGKKKKNMGFEGTIRCYVEKITGNLPGFSS